MTDRELELLEQDMLQLISDIEDIIFKFEQKNKGIQAIVSHEVGITDLGFYESIVKSELRIKEKRWT